MSLNQLTNPAQASWPAIVNENFAAAGVELYAYNYQTTTGLIEGGYGGDYGTTAISPWTVTLTASDINYIVAHRTTGVVSVSIATTNWDDTATYGRVRQNTTNGSGTTSRIDWRFLEGGIFAIGSGAGVVDAADVTYTPADLADWVGSADPGDVSDALDQLANRVSGFETGGVNPVEHIAIAVSDETSALTTGTAKVTFRMPYAFTLTEVRSSVTTAPTGASLVVDINENGSTIMTTNKLSIDATEKTSTTAATPPGITDSSLANDAEITIDIDQIGSTIAGAGLKVYLIGSRA